MDSAELAWAAGLFEGEGCICIFQRKPHGRHPQVSIAIEMADLDVLERFRTIVACGSIGPPRFYENRSKPGSPSKVTYCWRVGNRADVGYLLEAFLPWFGARRSARALEALQEVARFDRNCGHCGAEFRARSDIQVYCSAQCRLGAWHGRRLERAAA